MRTDNIYHFRNNITNPQGKLLEDKVNYFADYFQLSLHTWGKPFISELENQKSLVEKILFQLENYSSYSRRYISVYFDNKLLSNDDLIIKNFYSKEWKKLTKWAKKEVDFTNKLNLSNAIKELKEFVELLDKSLFQNCVNWLINVFLCPEPLEEHSHIQIIEYLSQIMLSEFFYAGFRRKELKEIFRKILDNTIDFNNGKPKTRMPLPKELHDLKYSDPKKYFEEVTKFLENRDLKQQFMGIYNFLKNEQREYTYVFKLDNTKAKEKIDWMHNAVHLSNRLGKKYLNKKSSEKYLEFFANKEIVFAETTVMGTNYENAKANALREINNTIQYLRLLGKSKISVNVLEYIEKERDSNSKFTFTSDYLFNKDKKKFDEANINFYFRRHDNALIRRLKEIDYIFINGKVSINKETKLVNLWRYLECFCEGAHIPETISSIVSNHYSNKYVEYFMDSLEFIYDEFNNPTVFDNISIPRDEFYQLMNEIRFKSFDLTRFAEVTNHPFLTNEIKSFIAKDKTDKIGAVKTFYKKILIEAYEQRNFIEHDGRFNEKAVDKVLMSLPHITSIFRNLIIVNSKNKKFESFEQIKEKLLKSKPYIVYKMTL